MTDTRLLDYDKVVLGWMETFTVERENPVRYDLSSDTSQMVIEKKIDSSSECLLMTK